MRLKRRASVPIPDNMKGPADAVGALYRYLKQTPTIYFNPRDLRDDLQTLRALFNDADYTAALVAFLKELQRAMRDPTNYGGELSYQFAGVRRHKFPLEDQREAILRMLEKPFRGGMYLLAIRHRHEPEDSYDAVQPRLPRIPNK
jgi:hypothetical protein